MDTKTARKVLTEGVHIRKDGGVDGRSLRRTTDRDLDILARWNRGERQDAIAERYGLTQSAVSKMLVRLRKAAGEYVERPRRSAEEIDRGRAAA